MGELVILSYLLKISLISSGWSLCSFLRINDYLDFCESRGEQPNKPFSGKLLLRLELEWHWKLYDLRTEEGERLNTWVASQLEKLTAK